MDPATTTWKDLPIPERSDCRLLNEVAPSATLDSRLAFMEECRGEDPGDVVAELVEWDPATGKSTTKAAIPSGIGSISWSGGRGYIWTGGGPCEGILAVTEAGTTYPAIEVQGDGHTFRLDDPGIDTIACDGTGRARFPVIGKTGRIAFFAAPAAVGLSGSARLKVQFGLYTLGEADKAGTLVLDKVSKPQGLAWSPDGKSLAFSGEGTGLGTGIWIATIANGSLVQLSALAVGSVAWSPDGRTIAALHIDAIGQEPHDIDLFMLPTAMLTER